MKKIIDVGTFVKSNFRAGWKGIVTSFEVQSDSGKHSNKICEVLLLKDRNGKNIEKRKTMFLSDGWLEIVDEFQLNEKQIDWIGHHRLRAKLLDKFNQPNQV